ncbi:hypothetical protein [Blastococcus sp. CCUG 61487]|uniref:hypothetical protein n=1 Tax=Blastococcus sp. CCUG 61487 TaxID=1840703 RepID=UPI0010BFBD2A|nr:hypothetical protein [Blastococcus sp. CCUG 61487]TKJ20515.1 hypothetical protein A6V29_08615 [Blastococcus sp. CCUG 61487]
MDAPTASAELAALQADRAALADRVVQPWWYDVLLGLLVFVFLGSYATGNWWVIGGAWLVAGLGVWALTRVYRRLTGFWVSGLRPGATQRAMRVWFWCCVSWGAVALLHAFVEETAVTYLLVAVSAACGIAMTFVSRWWTRIYVAELRGEL